MPESQFALGRQSQGPVESLMCCFQAAVRTENLKDKQKSARRKLIAYERGLFGFDFLFEFVLLLFIHVAVFFEQRRKASGSRIC